MLRFYARPGHVLQWPGAKFQGQPPRYVGRSNKVTRDAAGKVTAIEHPAQPEAVEVDENSDAGRRVLRLMRIESEKPLIPADVETAKACGVAYEPVELRDGEWLPKASGKGAKSSTEKGADQ